MKQKRKTTITHSMIKLKFIPVFIVACLSFMACSEKAQTPNEDQGKINKTFLKNVKTSQAVLSDQTGELVLTGKVEYNPDKVVNYVPIVNGVVERTYFTLGDKVQNGQVLLDIKGSDLTSLQSEYIAAESEVKIAQREMQSAQSMYDDKMLSEKELMEARSQLAQAEASFSKAKSDISTLGINKGNGIFSIKSPMTGYIIDKQVSSGSPISADGDPIFVVANLDEVWVTMNIYASNLKAVKEGMEVEITTLSYPDEVFTGKIAALSQVFDPEEKVLKARVIMPNKELKFKPEMSVVVKLKSTLAANKIAIPTDAIIFDQNRSFVVVEDSKDNFQVREVELEGHHQNTTFIRSGLNEGENVVVKNQLLIYFGLNDK